MSRRPLPRRRWIIAGLCLGVVAVAAGLALTLPRTVATADTGADLAPVATEKVTRGPLTERVRLSGRLSYEDARDLGSALSGTITALPSPGTLVERGGELFRIDNRPVSLLVGDLPMWRSFDVDMADGPDVTQLEENLAALGYFDRQPDAEFTWATAQAVKAWQKALGVTQSGEIELGRVVFAPGPLRVSAQQARLGDAAGGAILTVSGTDKRVSASIDPGQRQIAPVGAKVQLSLPGGGVTDGTVAQVGAVTEVDGKDGAKLLKIPLAISLDDPAVAEGLDGIGVSGEVTAVIREDALTVPVASLLATSDGGHAVEVRADGTTRIVPIQLGAFADGFVEVTGGELRDGDDVVVAK